MMNRPRRVLRGLAIAAAGYLLVLVLLGWALEGLVEDRVRSQLEYMLRANDATVEDVDVSLLRGQVTLRGLAAKRSGIGTATLEIAKVAIDIAPMGLAVFDQEPGRIELVGAHLELSAVGAATLQSSDDVENISVGEFIIRDSRVSIAVTSLFPGLGQAEFRVDQALARNVELHNSMSWLYKTEELKAELSLPGPMQFGVAYGANRLSVHGSILGSEPITIPFVWPNPDPSELELSQILSLAKELIRQLAPEVAKRQAKDVWDEMVDAF